MKIVQIPKEPANDLVAMLRMMADRIENGDDSFKNLYLIAERPDGRLDRYGWGVGTDDLVRSAGMLSLAMFDHNYAYLVAVNQGGDDDDE